MKPNIADTASGYTFSWPDHGVEIHTQRVQVHKSDGRVTGEIYVMAMNNTEMVTIYPPTSYNFSAGKTRKELANSLKLKNTKLPWGDMIDQLCFGILERARKGEPVVELCTAGDTEPPTYICYPLIVANYPNVLFGDPGAFKSGAAVILAQVVMLPWKDNPMGIVAPQRSHKVLYLDWETDAATIQWQTKLLQRGLPNMPEMFLSYRHCASPLYNDLEEIKLHISDTQADLIIIDSLGLAAGGELNETQPALNFYMGLRTLNTTSLILAHNSKDREARTRSIYGNQFFTAGARNVWEVRKTQEEGSDEMALALFHRKPPPFAGLHKTLGFKLHFTQTSMTIEPSDPKNVGEFLEQMGVKAQILQALKGGSLSQEELSEAVDKPSATIRARCHDLKKQSKITKVGENWGLMRND